MKWPQKELLSFFTDAKPWEGMNKEMSLKELINGYPFQSDSKATPACVTIMDLLTFLQRYSNRYQNILMQCNTGWNIIATSQQTKTSWDNCIAKENWLSPLMPSKTLRPVFWKCVIWCKKGQMRCSESAHIITWYQVDISNIP